MEDNSRMKNMSNRLKRKPRRIVLLPPISEKVPVVAPNSKTTDKTGNEECKGMPEENEQNVSQVTSNHVTDGNEETKQNEDSDDKNSTSNHGLWYKDDNSRTKSEEDDDKQNQSAFDLDDFLNVNNNNNGDGDTKEENGKDETTGNKKKHRVVLQPWIK